jgi:hypothetical protein
MNRHLIRFIQLFLIGAALSICVAIPLICLIDFGFFSWYLLLDLRQVGNRYLFAAIACNLGCVLLLFWLYPERLARFSVFVPPDRLFYGEPCTDAFLDADQGLWMRNFGIATAKLLQIAHRGIMVYVAFSIVWHFTGSDWNWNTLIIQDWIFLTFLVLDGLIEIYWSVKTLVAFLRASIGVVTLENHNEWDFRACNSLDPVTKHKIRLSYGESQNCRCGLKRIPMDHHCNICDTHVAEYDHHCYIMGRCVAGGNHLDFLKTVTRLISTLIAGSCVLATHLFIRQQHYISKLITGSCVIATHLFIRQQHYNLMFCAATQDEWPAIWNLISPYLDLTCLVFSLVLACVLNVTLSQSHFLRSFSITRKYYKIYFESSEEGEESIGL